MANVNMSEAEQSLYADLLKARTAREQGVEYVSGAAVLKSIDQAIERMVSCSPSDWNNT